MDKKNEKPQPKPDIDELIFGEREEKHSDR